MSGAATPAVAACESGDAAIDVLPVLYVSEANQWLSMSTGRIALDGCSWMQAVDVPVRGVAAECGSSSRRAVTPGAISGPVEGVQFFVTFAGLSVRLRPIDALEYAVPSSGRHCKISSRLEGASGVFRAGRALSIGDLVHGRRMDHVLTALRGVR